jgi:hypothetical protein
METGQLFVSRPSIQPNQKSCVERHNAKSVILHAWIVKITSQKVDLYQRQKQHKTYHGPYCILRKDGKLINKGLLGFRS